MYFVTAKDIINKYDGEFIMNISLSQILAYAVVIIVCLPVHECAHGLVAYWLGDPTAKSEGRLTLNPIKHIDIIGSICLLFAGFGWAKPVPINVAYFKNAKLGMAVSALAGPLSNFLMASASIIFYKLVYYFNIFNGTNAFRDIVETIFQHMVMINIVLCIFNLIPIPPFDGSRIFTVFLPKKIYFGIMKFERYLFIGLAVIIFTGILNEPLSFMYTSVFNFLDRITWFIDLLATSIFR